MPVSLRMLFVGALLALGRAGAGELTLPPIDGEVSGDFVPLRPGGAPELHWRIAGQPPSADGTRTVTITGEGAGAELSAEANMDLSGDGTWRLERARFDLARWLPVAMAAAEFPAANMVVAGQLSASGEGRLRGGKPGGRLRLVLEKGRMEDTEHKLALEGVAFELTVEDLATRQTARMQRVTWTGGRYDVITLGAGHLVFELNGDHVHVDEAVVAAFGGELALGAFDFSISRPEIAVVAKVIGAEVGLFLPLLPPMVADANGRVDGAVTLRRDASGIQVGNGHLALRGGESAELRLLPTPGLLSSSLPETVKKYYPGLADLEAGKVPLKADLLEISFTPQGDAQGRTASVHVVGGPSDPRLRAPVDLTLNVRGPLEWLVKFGTDSRLHWGGGH